MSPKLPRITASQFARALERDGWFFVRQRGSHRFFAHSRKAGLVVVPVHSGGTLKLGLLNDMLKERWPDAGGSGEVAMRRYTVFLTPDLEEGGYTVRVPALPGCNTQGDTLEEALANAREAIEGYLETLKQLGRPIPEEQEHPQAVVIEVAA